MKLLTQVEPPVEVVDSNLGELGHDKATHPVGRSGSSGATSSPAQRVDLRVVDPRDFGETSSIEEVVHEEHGRSNLAEL